MVNNYLENCKSVVSALDVESLASRRPESAAGRGSGFEFRPLGKLLLANSVEQHVGIKIPLRQKSDAETRFVGELAFTNFILNAAPELFTYVPSFMAVVAFENDNSLLGILTEDVSDGGAKTVTGIHASNRVRKLLYAPFQDIAPIEDVLSEEECDDSVAFNVDGTERLLDFTPLPIRSSLVYSASAYHMSHDDVLNVMPELTIFIPRGSVLYHELTKA